MYKKLVEYNLRKRAGFPWKTLGAVAFSTIPAYFGGKYLGFGQGQQSVYKDQLNKFDSGQWTKSKDIGILDYLKNNPGTAALIAALGLGGAFAAGHMFGGKASQAISNGAHAIGWNYPAPPPPPSKRVKPKKKRPVQDQQYA